MKRPALKNKGVAVLRKASRARKIFGTFEKRAPCTFINSGATTFSCNKHFTWFCERLLFKKSYGILSFFHSKVLNNCDLNNIKMTTKYSLLELRHLAKIFAQSGVTNAFSKNITLTNVMDAKQNNCWSSFQMTVQKPIPR